VNQTLPVEFINERLLEWGTIAMNDSGQALLVWMFEFVDPVSGAKSLENWANRYVPGVGWGTAQRISSAGMTAWYPEIVIEANGDGIAFFYEDGAPKVAHFTNGSGWNTPIPIGGQASIINTMDRGASGIVTTGWSQNGFSSNRYKSGLGWQGQSQVVAPTGSSMNRLDFGVAQNDPVNNSV